MPIQLENVNLYFKINNSSINKASPCQKQRDYSVVYNTILVQRSLCLKMILQRRGYAIEPVREVIDRNKLEKRRRE
jgi:hypothetical protein